MSGPVSIYVLATGLLTGDIYAGDDIAANLPAGCGFVSGRHDHLSRAVDLATGELVDYQPPAPAGDALRTWSWDSTVRRWLPMPTLVALQAARVETVDAALADIERRQQRPLGDILVALTAGQAPAAPDVAALAQLRADAAAARTVRALMLASTTPEQLAAIVWPLEAP